MYEKSLEVSLMDKYIIKIINLRKIMISKKRKIFFEIDFEAVSRFFRGRLRVIEKSTRRFEDDYSLMDRCIIKKKDLQILLRMKVVKSSTLQYKLGGKYRPINIFRDRFRGCLKILSIKSRLKI